MKIIQEKRLKLNHKEQLMKLWNNEYPIKLRYETLSDFERYLKSLKNSDHVLLVDDINDNIIGWAVDFEREGGKWFAIIVDSNYQGNGAGKKLLNHLKARNAILNGWVIDHDEEVKSSGKPYRSPLGFYKKNEFSVENDIRLMNSMINAVKIKWTDKV